MDPLVAVDERKVLALKVREHHSVLYLIASIVGDAVDLGGSESRSSGDGERCVVVLRLASADRILQDALPRR
ncbi:MAG TPA: hypothetical protein VGI92_10885 [Gemmatimonadales bacterium]|jgi:hypothetical protein